MRTSIMLIAAALAACGDAGGSSSDTMTSEPDATTTTTTTDTSEPTEVGEETSETTETAETIDETCEGDACACVDGAVAIDCACVIETGCENELVCAEVVDGEGQGTGAFACREELACEDVLCGANQLCGEGEAGVDAACLESCAPGYTWNALTAACDANPVAHCGVDFADPDAIGDDCQDQYRECVPGDGVNPAECGDCLASAIDAGASCRLPLGCASIEDMCTAAHRACVAAVADPPTDARCGECVAPYVADGDACVVDGTANCDPDGANSLYAECQSQHRECVETGAAPRCGLCLAGYGESPTTTLCELPSTCAEQGCDALGRECVDNGFARCGDCKDDLKPTDPGDPQSQCAAALTCLDLDCGDGYCIASSDPEVDATCATSTCNTNQALIQATQTCKTCTGACDKTGHTGRWWLHTDSAGRCLCETEEGYYLETALSVLPQPCDEDGDGWVREAARTYVEFASEPEVQANARCDLHTIDRITLRNEWQQEYVVRLCATGQPVAEGVSCATTQPLDLYEATELDEDGAMPDDVRFPSYQAGAMGRSLEAAELNPLTKACVSTRGDFNDNGIADIEEAAEMELPGGITLDATQAWLLHFGYFLELHTGSYRPRPGEDYGTYVIEERSRCSDDAFFLGYDEASGSDYWRDCSRNRGGEYNRNVIQPGFDFARWMCTASNGPCAMPDPPTDVTPVGSAPDHGLCEVALPPADATWRGMTHHAQFRCVEAVASEAEVEDPWQQAVSAFYDKALAQGGTLQMNDCAATGIAVGSGNPSTPTLVCDEVAPPASAVGFAAVRYDDETSEGDYTWGCVDEWRTWPELCPGYDTGLPDAEQTVIGDALSADFGDLVCGCGENYGGLGCDQGCPSTDLMLSPGYTVTPRQGFWLCGETSASACYETTAFEPLSFPGFAGQTQAWTLIAPATFSGGALQVTPDAGNQTGVAWHTEKVDVSDGFTARIDFEFTTSTIGGADGMAFVLQNVGLAVTGNENGVSTNALSIGLDSFDNSAADLDQVVRVVRNGETLDEVDLGGDWTNSGWHVLEVVYRDDILDVAIDGEVVIDALPVALAGYGVTDDDGRAWVGFTGRTGSQYEKHLVYAFRMDGTPRPCDENEHFATDGDGAVWTLTGGIRRYGIAGTALRDDDSRTCDELSLDPTAHGDDDLVCASTPSCGGFETYAAAAARCDAANMRLCTENELMGFEAASSGCDYESTLTWTSTTCGAGRYFVGPGSGQTSAELLPECHAATGATAVARCCADAVPGTSGWVLR